MNEELVTYSRENDILFTRSIKAGKRIYYLDVKKNKKDEFFLAITESKKIISGELFLAITESKRVLRNEESREIQFEKHKIFLYPKDFEKFIHGMNDVMEYIKSATDIK